MVNNFPYPQGSIIFCDFPFAEDLNKSKIRPAIILSKNQNSNTIIIAMVSSQIKNDDHSFLILDSMLSQPLRKKSEVRCNRIFSIDKSLILSSAGYFKDKNSLQTLIDKVKSYM